MQEEAQTRSSARKKGRTKSADTGQLGLFDVDTAPAGAPVGAEPPGQTRRPPKKTMAAKPKPTPAPRGDVRFIKLDDLPDYPPEIIAMVDNSIAALPEELAWLTYRDIRKRFGISRATIARRLKDGLIPGVRFQCGRMLDDGSVRRFDRTQLRWLLLAVRSSAKARAITGKQDQEAE